MTGEPRHLVGADRADSIDRVGPFRRYQPLEGSEAALLAQIGAEGRTRLEETPGVVRVPGHNIDMYAMREFLTAEESAELMRRIDADVRPSTRLGIVADPSHRTSETCRLSSDDPLVADVERRFSDLLGIPASHSETVQGQRYRAGQQFKLHNDYFAGGQPYSPTVASEGGQRTWTAMVFLNEPDAGGSTSFPRAGIKVKPRARALLAWFNLDRDGLPNPYTHHEGTMVESGTKYILTKWFREREWRSSAQSDALRV